MQSDLITRLEAATGPSRELDAEIVRLINPQATRLTRAPFYTGSLDAALTLVPEGRYVKMQINRRRTTAWAWVEFDDGETVACADPALALCIAALKARSA